MTQPQALGLEGYIPTTTFPDIAGQWFALRVRSNFERAAQVWLQGQGFDAFLPAYRSRRVWSDRTKWVDLPLFPGYLFCHFDPKNWAGIVRTPGLVGAVRSGPNLVAADEKEIQDLRTAVNSGLALDVYPFLEAGQRVKVRMGPLNGVQGWIVKLERTCKVVVSVTILQRALAVELDASCVEPVF